MLSIIFILLILYFVIIRKIFKINPILNIIKIFKASNDNNGRVFICATYNNEEEMAYIHLWRLYDYVDKFIIVVSNLTYSLQPKNVTFDLFKKELKRYKDKMDIVYFDNICTVKLNIFCLYVAMFFCILGNRRLQIVTIIRKIGETSSSFV